MTLRGSAVASAPRNASREKPSRGKRPGSAASAFSSVPRVVGRRAGAGARRAAPTSTPRGRPARPRPTAAARRGGVVAGRPTPPRRQRRLRAHPPLVQQAEREEGVVARARGRTPRAPRRSPSAASQRSRRRARTSPARRSARRRASRRATSRGRGRGLRPTRTPSRPLPPLARDASRSSTAAYRAASCMSWSRRHAARAAAAEKVTPSRAAGCACWRILIVLKRTMA